MDFGKFKRAVAAQFEKMSRHEVLRTTVDKELMTKKYIESFPEGSNPFFRKKTEHECTCCIKFIRAVGDAVSMIDGKLQSIWDINLTDEPEYQAVADAMAAFVKSFYIENRFLHPEKSAGTDKNWETILDEKTDKRIKVKEWEHFFVPIWTGRNTGEKLYCDEVSIGTKLSEARALYNVFFNGLTRISAHGLTMTLELIDQKSGEPLYRGTEFRHMVVAFQKEKEDFDKIPDWDARARDLFAWSRITTVAENVAKFRGTSIGQLAENLTEGMDIEVAVGKYEHMVAPENYHRTTALVSQKQVDEAREKIEELGLTSALNRRYARIEDISVNNVLFADSSARAVMKDAFSGIATKKPAAVKKQEDAAEISIADFIANILPNISTMEVMFDNSHVNNLVSMIAPVDASSKHLFTWDNHFSWSYINDVTDASKIKEKVKKAGGNVTGDLCCRLAWFNHDDLDFHMIERPKADRPYEIYYHTKATLSPSGGMLDVDMNASRGTTSEPVENIFYKQLSFMKEGEYTLFVQNFAKREYTKVGFEVEIDYRGSVTKFVYEKALRDKENVNVAVMTYSKKDGITIKPLLPSTVGGTAPRGEWGLTTMQYHKVKSMMLSPNYWDENGSGNKHYMFMLDNCIRDGQARGFYTEHLTKELTQHRRVLELVGANMQTDESPHQLSGLGFSSTKRAELLVRVKGNINRSMKIVFN